MKRLVVLLAVCAALAGCGKVAAVSCPTGKVCIRAGNLADPSALDPAHAFLKQDQTVINDLLVGLTTFDTKGDPMPGMATSWTVSPDQLVWTFKLREARWSDGAPVTAQDFVFSLRRLVDPATGSPYANLAYPVLNAEAVNRGRAPPGALGIRALDPHTVQITLGHVTPYLPTLLAHYGLAPVPEHAVRRWGDHWSAPGRYVSNGPYLLASWRLGDRIVLEKNPLFYDAARVCIDRVDYLPVTDLVSAERRVRSGELDLNAAFASDRIRYLMGPSGMANEVKIAPWTDINYVVFNLSSPPLKDVRVRQALAMAIDRDFIALKLLGAGQEPTASLTPPGLGALPATPDWARLSLAQRQTRARALLAQAGYGPGHPLRLELKAPIDAAGLTTAILSDWRDIGVETSITKEDLAVFFNDLELGDFQAGFTDWIADYPYPTDFLDLLRSNIGASNYGGYKDPAYDALLDEALGERSDPRRAQLMQAAERRMLQAAPVAPIYVNPSHNLVSPRVIGWQANLNDVHPMRWLCVKPQTTSGSNSATR